MAYRQFESGFNDSDSDSDQTANVSSSNDHNPAAVAVASMPTASNDAVDMDQNLIQSLNMDDEPAHLHQERDPMSQPISSRISDLQRKLHCNKRVVYFLLFLCVLFLSIFIAAVVWEYTAKSDSCVSCNTSETDDRDNNDRDVFIRSPSDTDREFRMVTLANSLQVLLISDAATDKSAVAIDVAVGSSEDPLQYLGLAHFHEHMLFLGSETFDGEDDFSGFVSMHGGSDNAYTDKTHTNFFFDVDREHLEHSLYIFSRFFIDPLLTRDAILREVNAVDNEYRKDISSQSWRMFRMLEYSADARDPFHKFTVGSIETLNHSGVYEAMQAFHDRFFVADLMKAVVYGKEDLDTLQAYAVQYLEPIPQSTSTVPVSAPRYNDTRAFGANQTRVLYEVRSLDASTKQLTLVWAFDSLELHTLYQSPMLSVLNDVVVFRSNASLFDYLSVTRGWITDATAEAFYDELDWVGNAVTFELTRDGLAHYTDIIAYLYDFLALLESQQSQIEVFYEQQQCMQQLRFKFYSLIKQKPYDIVSDVARRMQYRDGRDLLYTAMDVTPQRSVYDADLMQQIVQVMRNPQNVVIYKLSDEHADAAAYEQVEPFFSIEFNATRVTDTQWQSWMAMPSSTAPTTDSPLRLSLHNSFIDARCNLSGVELIQLSDADKEAFVEPVLVVDAANMRVWYKPDVSFDSPQINVNVLLISPFVYGDAMNATLTQLWLHLVSHYASQWYAFAESAGYIFKLSTQTQGIQVEISCVNRQYLQVFMRQILDFLTRVSDYMSRDAAIEQTLANVLSAMHDAYVQYNFDWIWHQSYYRMYDITQRPYYSQAVMLDTIAQLQNQFSVSGTQLVQNLATFVSSIQDSGVLLEALFHGNLYQSDVGLFVDEIRQQIEIRNDPLLEHDFVTNIQQRQHLNLEIAAHNKWMYRGLNGNPDDTNDVAAFHVQFASNSHQLETAQVLLLAQMMTNEAFNVLRTQEALGYVATAFARSDQRTNDINYLVILVVSGHYSAQYLHDRIVNFTQYFYDEFLASMDQSSFASYINATISEIDAHYLSLAEETDFLWQQISNHHYFFNRTKQLKDLLLGSNEDEDDEITLASMKRFYMQTVLSEQSKCLSVQLYSNRSVALRSNDEITDFVLFNDTKELQLLPAASFFNVY